MLDRTKGDVLSNLLSRLRGGVFYHHWDHYFYDKDLSRTVAVELAGWMVEKFDALYQGRKTCLERWAGPSGNIRYSAPGFAENLDTALSLLDLVLPRWTVQSINNFGVSWKAVIIRTSASIARSPTRTDGASDAETDERAVFDGCRNPMLAIIGAVATAGISDHRRRSPARRYQKTRERRVSKWDSVIKDNGLQSLQRKLEAALGSAACHATTSVDAALALVRTRLPDWSLELSQHPTSRQWRVLLCSVKGWFAGCAYPTPAAATVAAFLGALPIDVATDAFYDGYLDRIGLMPTAANDP